MTRTLTTSTSSSRSLPSSPCIFSSQTRSLSKTTDNSNRRIISLYIPFSSSPSSRRHPYSPPSFPPPLVYFDLSPCFSRFSIPPTFASITSSLAQSLPFQLFSPFIREERVTKGAKRHETPISFSVLFGCIVSPVYFSRFLSSF